MLPSTPRTNPDLCLYSPWSYSQYLYTKAAFLFFPSQTVVLSIILGIQDWDTMGAFHLMKPLQPWTEAAEMQQLQTPDMHPCTATATRHTQHAPRPSYQHSQHALPLQARGGRWQVFTVSTVANRGLFITPDFLLTLSCARLGDVVPDLSKPNGALLDEISQTQVMPRWCCSPQLNFPFTLITVIVCHWPLAQVASSDFK